METTAETTIGFKVDSREERLIEESDGIPVMKLTEMKQEVRDTSCDGEEEEEFITPHIMDDFDHNTQTSTEEEENEKSWSQATGTFSSSKDSILHPRTIAPLPLNVKVEPASEEEWDCDHPCDTVIKQEIAEADARDDYFMEGEVNQAKTPEGEDSGAEETNDHIKSLSDGALVVKSEDADLPLIIPDVDISEQESMSDINDEMDKQQHCRKMDRKKHIFQEHIKTHCGRTCPVCGKVFDSNQTCLQHMWHTHTGENFNHMSDFTCHNPLSPSNERPYSCDLCEKTFRLKTHLQKHRAKSHSNRRPYSCDMCDKTFKQKVHLQEHQASCHSNERPFSCDVCEKTFKRKTVLQKHKTRCHSNERPHSCDLCEKTFKQKCDLQRHKETCHSKERPHSCDVCEKTFKRKSNLQRHKTNCHSDGRPH